MTMLSENETAQIFAASSYQHALTHFRLITSGIGIICMTLLEMNRKKFVAHKSLKMLLNFHGFWTLTLNIATFVESSLQGYTDLTLKNPSDLLLTSNQCLVRMCPQFFAICGSVISLLLMSFERFEASRNLATYEFSTSGNGCKFVLIHIVLILMGVFMDVFHYGFPTRIPHCTVGSLNNKNIQSVLVGSLTISEILTIFFYKKSLKQNEHIRDSKDSLFMSLYQLSENIRVLRLLLPVVISHTSITMAGAVGYFWFELRGMQKELYPMLEDTINLVYLQGIAMPTIFYVQYRRKRSMEDRLVTVNKYSGEELTIAHDEAITRGW